MTPQDRRARGISSLPEDLADAIKEMERSELVAEALGEHVFEEFLRNKRLEWDGYRNYVSPFELDRYLPLL
jgi:glutamine synthetase